MNTEHTRKVQKRKDTPDQWKVRVYLNDKYTDAQWMVKCSGTIFCRTRKPLGRWTYFGKVKSILLEIDAS